MKLNSPGKIALFAIILFIGAYLAGYYGHTTVVEVPVDTNEGDQTPASPQAPTPIPPVRTPTQPNDTPPIEPHMVIDPVSVVEDSRCPVNANCVWAGTVKVSVHVENEMQAADEVLTLGQPTMVLGKTITLTEVRPQKTTAPIPFSDYRFTFDIR